MTNDHPTDILESGQMTIEVHAGEPNPAHPLSATTTGRMGRDVLPQGHPKIQRQAGHAALQKFEKRGAAGVGGLALAEIS